MSRRPDRRVRTPSSATPSRLARLVCATRTHRHRSGQTLCSPVYHATLQPDYGIPSRQGKIMVVLAASCLLYTVKQVVTALHVSHCFSYSSTAWHHAMPLYASLPCSRTPRYSTRSMSRGCMGYSSAKSRSASGLLRQQI